MNIVNILFLVHPDLLDSQRVNIEEMISSNNGVMHVQFNKRDNHELNVSYDPDAIKADTLLKQMQDWDHDVKMIGL